jgi:hypothetical protein
MFDEHRREALLVLEFHGVEDTAIGINADKEFLCGFQVFQDLRVAHEIRGREVGLEERRQSNKISNPAAFRLDCRQSFHTIRANEKSKSHETTIQKGSEDDEK